MRLPAVPPALAPAAALSLLLSGCASTVFDARTDLVGDASRHAFVQPAANTPRLYVETSPEGFDLKPDSEIIYDKYRYEYLGKVFVKRNFEHWRLGFVSYNEPWRRYYCPPVVTLTYGSGLLLGLTPLPYFCAYEASPSNARIEERKRHMLAAAQEEGRRIGATLLVYARYTGLEYPAGGGDPRPVDNFRPATAVGSPSEQAYMGLVAHAFKRK